MRQQHREMTEIYQPAALSHNESDQMKKHEESSNVETCVTTATRWSRS
jgi:hypothetical protein